MPCPDEIWRLMLTKSDKYHMHVCPTVCVEWCERWHDTDADNDAGASQGNVGRTDKYQAVVEKLSLIERFLRTTRVPGMRMGPWPVL